MHFTVERARYINLSLFGLKFVLSQKDWNYFIRTIFYNNQFNDSVKQLKDSRNNVLAHKNDVILGQGVRLQVELNDYLGIIAKSFVLLNRLRSLVSVCRKPENQY